MFASAFTSMEASDNDQGALTKGEGSVQLTSLY
jgi:hypothetical protein